MKEESGHKLKITEEYFKQNPKVSLHDYFLP